MPIASLCRLLRREISACPLLQFPWAGLTGSLLKSMKWAFFLHSLHYISQKGSRISVWGTNWYQLLQRLGFQCEIYRQIVRILHVVSGAFCFPGDCTVLESEMDKNNIKLPWRKPYTYRSKERISFTCKWFHRAVSRPEKFNPQCLDGVIEYPQCTVSSSYGRAQGAVKEL